MEKSFVKNHFETYAEQWIENSYDGSGHIYPTARHRADVVCRIFADHGPLDIVDLGCGGGNLAIQLAEEGHRILGIDQSKRMIDVANSTKSELPPEIRDKVDFLVAELERPDLPNTDFDAVTAMGVIGYLDSDEPLFETASSLMKPGGTLAVSCRNRLFNMNSLSFRTITEIEKGSAGELIEELFEYYKPLPAPAVEELVEGLMEAEHALTQMLEGTGATEEPTNASAEEPAVEPRQHTPRGLAEVASRYRFQQVDIHGVHPHLMDPNLNKLLPPGVFNLLCGCLESLHYLPVSITWSSVFISVFKKEC